ncbi:MAG: hypothetical protein IT242_08495, partial [Bacteroidia bacterium]|nr:hypothetical protein [Bacteroidia bacterium]
MKTSYLVFNVSGIFTQNIISMKFIYSLLILSLISELSTAQLTLGTGDFSHANDTFRVSTGQSFSGMDPALTGPNYTWDYSQLTPVSQTVDSFVDESSTNPLFAIIFIDNALNSNRANQAAKGDAYNLGQVNVSDVFNFYYNSTTAYKQVGIGANVNGVPLPVVYSPHDLVYQFPLDYLNSDSSQSGYQVDLTSTLGLFYSVHKQRNNLVDGWGTITTPYGTFDVLRITSTVTERDSVYIDSLGIGLATPAITTHEYKWCGAGGGIPLLQINTTAGNVVTSIRYRDSLLTTGLVNPETGIVASLFPNPAIDFSRLTVSDCTGYARVDVLSLGGKCVYSQDGAAPPDGRVEMDIPIAGLNLE